MDTKKLENGSRDAISCLPEEVMGKILSLLPTKLAASTSVLSRKWRNVFPLVHNLDFDESDFMHLEKAEEDRAVIFKNFVDRTLALQCGSPIKEFCLSCYCDDHIELANVYNWIRNPVKRAVLELDVNIQTDCEVYLPCELFRSKTLVKLSLGTKLFLGKIPPDASLPALKSLSIDSIYFYDKDLCDVFLAGCPLLEELFVRHKEFVGHPKCICSRSIKKLSVHYDGMFQDNRDRIMSFDAPSLVTLDYSGYALAFYPKNFSSLVEARLDLHSSKDFERPNLSSLIIGISKVETLDLSRDAGHVICGCVEHGLVLPVFNNLVKLSFGSKNKKCWRLLTYLLKQSPTLETLIIQDLWNGYTCDVTLSPYQVKVLRVLSYGRTAQELKHLKSFLGETHSLELVQVAFMQSAVVDDGIISQFNSDITTLLSPKCELEVTYFIPNL